MNYLINSHYLVVNRVHEKKGTRRVERGVSLIPKKDLPKSPEIGWSGKQPEVVSSTIKNT